MKYIDPSPVDCPSCGGRHPVFIDDLRSGEALCPGCGFRLEEKCRRFKESEDRVHRQFEMIEMELTIEDMAGISIDSDRLGDSPTLEDLTLAVANALQSEPDPMAKAAELVEAARRLVQ